MSGFIPGVIPSIPLDQEINKEELKRLEKLERLKRRACIEKTFKKIIGQGNSTNTYLEKIYRTAGLKLDAHLLSFEKDICSLDEKGELEVSNLRVLINPPDKVKFRVKVAKYATGGTAVVFTGGLILLAHGMQKLAYKAKKVALEKQEKKQRAAAVSMTTKPRVESTLVENTTSLDSRRNSQSAKSHSQ